MAIAGALFLSSAIWAQTPEYVMVNEEWAPYRIGTNERPEEWTGIDVDLVREIEKRLSVKIAIKSAPWSRCLEMIKLGQADIMTGVAWTAERAAEMAYVPTSYSSVRPAFYAIKGKGSAIRSYADLAGKKIGQSTNSAYFEPYNTDASLNKISVRDEETILRMLAAGRIDLAVGTEPNLGWDAARFGLRDLVEPTAWQPEQVTPLYLVIPERQKLAGLDKRLDVCLREMMSDGTMATILAKYK